MLLSVITVNFNGIVYTRDFLDSLCGLSESDDVEIIVVDNASDANEAEVLQKEYPWVKCVRSEENLGFSGGNNLGAKRSRGKYLLFVNNDIIANADALFRLVDVLKSNPDVAAVSPCIVNANGSYAYTGSKPLGKYLLRLHYSTEAGHEAGEVPLIHGAAVMMPRAKWEEVGGWPEPYFLYFEEVDLSLHLKKLGYKLWYEPKAQLIHIGSCSTGRNSPLSCYYGSRNHLLLYCRNLDGWKKLYAVMYHLLLIVPHNIVVYIRNRQFPLVKAYCAGVKDFLRGRFGKRV